MDSRQVEKETADRWRKRLTANRWGKRQEDRWRKRGR